MMLPKTILEEYSNIIKYKIKDQLTLVELIMEDLLNIYLSFQILSHSSFYGMSCDFSQGSMEESHDIEEESCENEEGRGLYLKLQWQPQGINMKDDELGLLRKAIMMPNGSITRSRTKKLKYAFQLCI